MEAPRASCAAGLSRSRGAAALVVPPAAIPVAFHKMAAPCKVRSCDGGDTNPVPTSVYARRAASSPCTTGTIFNQAVRSRE